MVMTLEQIRDNYDTNKDRYIDEAELEVAKSDWTADVITTDDIMAIINAYNNQTLLPAYDELSVEVSFFIPTEANIAAAKV